ncbi:hypothetical protein ABK040_002114 [Willaertia magna]
MKLKMNTIFTLFDIAGPKAKSYLRINELKDAIMNTQLFRSNLLYKLSPQFFNKLEDLIHRFIIYLLLESKPLFTVKESTNNNLETILREYAMERPLQYLKDYCKDIDIFYNDSSYSSLFEVYNDNTLQQDEMIITDKERNKIKKKKKIIEYVPLFISNYFLNITKKYFPNSVFRNDVYNEIKFKSFEDTYYNINRLIFDDQIFSKFITKYFNINYDIFENKNYTNIDHKYLLEIISRSFCSIGERISSEYLFIVKDYGTYYRNEFIHLNTIGIYIFSLQYLNFYCFPFLFNNNYTIIQNNNDLSTFTILENNLKKTIEIIKEEKQENELEDLMLFFKPTIDLSKLPIDIHSIILRFINNCKELLELRLVCKHWNNLIVNNNDIWKYHCYNTLIENSLFNLCDTKSLPFIEFENRFDTNNAFTLFFTKIKPFLTFNNHKSCIYINPDNISIYSNTKGSTKFINENYSNNLSIKKVIQPDLPPGFTMKEDEIFIGQLNCKELSRFFSGSYLPKTGMIYIYKNIKNNKYKIEYINYEFNYDKFNAIEIYRSEPYLGNKLENEILFEDENQNIYLIQTTKEEKITILKQDLLNLNFSKVFTVGELSAEILTVIGELNERDKKRNGCTREDVFKLFTGYDRIKFENVFNDLLNDGLIFNTIDEYHYWKA